MFLNARSLVYKMEQQIIRETQFRILFLSSKKDDIEARIIDIKSKKTKTKKEEKILEELEDEFNDIEEEIEGLELSLKKFQGDDDDHYDYQYEVFAPGDY